jgi:hypothetical protein
MPKVELKLKGVQALQQRLLANVQAFEEQLEDELLMIAEDACRHAKEHKGYKDRTANLKNSISFVLYKDGQVVSKHLGENKPKDNDARIVTADYVQGRIDDYATKSGAASAKGHNLVIVAPMEYAAAVEHKGYNVLYLTNIYLQDRIKELMANMMNELKQTNV